MNNESTEEKMLKVIRLRIEKNMYVADACRAIGIGYPSYSFHMNNALKLLRGENVASPSAKRLVKLLKENDIIITQSGEGINRRTILAYDKQQPHTQLDDIFLDFKRKILAYLVQDQIVKPDVIEANVSIDKPTLPNTMLDGRLVYFLDDLEHVMTAYNYKHFITYHKEQGRNGGMHEGKYYVPAHEYDVFMGLREQD